jgi:hypothetical protein
MSSESRRGLRIALAFTSALVLAELIRIDLQLTFLAPLVAATLATGPRAPVSKLVPLPVIAWALVACAGFALQLLVGKPVVLCLMALCVFYVGFKMFQNPRTATIGLVTLVIFSIVPQTLIAGPELSADLAYWFGLNFSIAVLCEIATRTVLPDPTRPTGAPERPQLPPLAAALALLVAVILTAAFRPPAPGATMIGVILVLRADGEGAANVIHDRFVGALLGGGVAVIVWEILWLAPTLPTLATTVLLAAWPFARMIAAGGPRRGLAMKSLNVVAILMGEGFSVFFDDADDRIWTRIGGVVIGLCYGAMVLSLTGRLGPRRSDGPAAAPVAQSAAG